jgi:hypothetical protein
LGTVVTKDHQDSPRKIDAAVAATIAYDRVAVAAPRPFLLGDSKRVAGDHDVYALVGDREVERRAALERVFR